MGISNGGHVKSDIIFRVEHTSCGCLQKTFCSQSKLLQEMVDAVLSAKQQKLPKGICIQKSDIDENILIAVDGSLEAFNVLHKCVHGLE